jgi:hypothetical protein
MANEFEQLYIETFDGTFLNGYLVCRVARPPTRQSSMSMAVEVALHRVQATRLMSGPI